MTRPTVAQQLKAVFRFCEIDPKNLVTDRLLSKLPEAEQLDLFSELFKEDKRLASMKLIEVTLRGYDPTKSSTDDLVKWVLCNGVTNLRAYFDLVNLRDYVRTISEMTFPLHNVIDCLDLIVHSSRAKKIRTFYTFHSAGVLESWCKESDAIYVEQLKNARQDES